MRLDSLKDLYIDQLQDLYSAEQQLTSALPKMIEGASHPELKTGFRKHLDETEQHVELRDFKASGLRFALSDNRPVCLPKQEHQFR